MAAVEKLNKLVATSKVLVLSKTSCGYCARTKALLKELNVKDVNVVELDTRDDGADLQAAALKLTGQRTVPNVFIGQKHIGGNDKVQDLHKRGELVTMLRSLSCL